MKPTGVGERQIPKFPNPYTPSMTPGAGVASNPLGIWNGVLILDVVSLFVIALQVIYLSNRLRWEFLLSVEFWIPVSIAMIVVNAVYCGLNRATFWLFHRNRFREYLLLSASIIGALPVVVFSSYFAAIAAVN